MRPASSPYTAIPPVHLTSFCPSDFLTGPVTFTRRHYTAWHFGQEQQHAHYFHEEDISLALEMSTANSEGHNNSF